MGVVDAAHFRVLGVFVVFYLLIMMLLLACFFFVMMIVLRYGGDCSGEEECGTY
jgi:hypothetical protein